MKLRLAHRTDIAALRALWQECFGDEADYIDAFYSDRFDAILVPVATDDAGRVIGMIHMLPCHLFSGDAREGRALNGDSAYYLYAVGMTRAFRGQGVMRSLMTSLVDECKKRGMALLLSPVNSRLNAYYESYGFSYAAGAWQDFFDKAALDAPSDVCWRVCNAEEYFERRTACLSSCAHVAFPFDAVRYALAENAFCGGLALVSSHGEAALVRKSGDHLVVRELCTPCKDGRSARASLAALLSYMEAKSCEVRSHRSLSESARPLYTVMAHGKPFAEPFAYMNLLLD